LIGSSYGKEDEFSLILTSLLLVLLRVIQSKNSKFSVGDVVTATFGWTSHAICDDAKATESKVFKVDTSVVPTGKESYALGALGMPG